MPWMAQNCQNWPKNWHICTHTCFSWSMSARNPDIYTPRLFATLTEATQLISKARFTIWCKGLLVLRCLRVYARRNARIDSDSILAFFCVAFLRLVTKNSRIFDIFALRKLERNATQGPCVILWTGLYALWQHVPKLCIGKDHQFINYNLQSAAVYMYIIRLEHVHCNFMRTVRVVHVL